MNRDRNYLINFYNATSKDVGNDELETYEAWLERQLLIRIERLEKFDKSSLPPAEGAEDDDDEIILGEPDKLNLQWSGYGPLGNISQKPPQPTAEGAEEDMIYHNLTQPFRKVLQSVYYNGYDVIIAEKDCVKIARAFAALTADKMVEERLREELKVFYLYVDEHWALGQLTSNITEVIKEYLEDKGKGKTLKSTHN